MALQAARRLAESVNPRCFARLIPNAGRAARSRSQSAVLWWKQGADYLHASRQADRFADPQQNAKHNHHAEVWQGPHEAGPRCRSAAITGKATETIVRSKLVDQPREEKQNRIVRGWSGRDQPPPEEERLRIGCSDPSELDVQGATYTESGDK